MLKYIDDIRFFFGNDLRFRRSNLANNVLLYALSLKKVQVPMCLDDC